MDPYFIGGTAPHATGGAILLIVTGNRLAVKTRGCASRFCAVPGEDDGLRVSNTDAPVDERMTDKEPDMDRDTFDHRWWSLAREVLTGMKEWRLQNPAATFSQIEAALDQRLGSLRARMLEDVALASDAASWSAQAPTSPPPCPACGTPLHSRGPSTRHLQTNAGQEIALTRSYGTCPACQTGLFPPR